MENHKQQVIDGFVMAVIPTIVERDHDFDDFFFRSLDDYVDKAYSLAEALFERHRKTCEICKQEEKELEIF
jgi:hypothetical protein